MNKKHRPNDKKVFGINQWFLKFHAFLLFKLRYRHSTYLSSRKIPPVILSEDLFWSSTKFQVVYRKTNLKIEGKNKKSPHFNKFANFWDYFIFYEDSQIPLRFNSSNFPP